MKSKLCWLVVASVAICLAAAGHAEATTYGTLTAEWWKVSPGKSVRAYAWHGTGYDTLNTMSGVYNFHFKSATSAEGQTNPLEGMDYWGVIKTHCIDISQYVGGEETWDVCSLDESPIPTTYGGPIDSTQENLLQRLFYQYPTATTAPVASARQLAVWEIVFDKDDLDPTLSTSRFYVTNDDGAGDDAKDMLTAITTSWSWSGKTKPTLYAFVDDGSQDQLWLGAGVGAGQEPIGVIPEPLTMLGMFLGLGSVGAYIKRRRMK